MALKVSVRLKKCNGGFEAIVTSVWRRPGVIPEGFRKEAVGETQEEAEAKAKALLEADPRFQFANQHAQ